MKLAYRATVEKGKLAMDPAVRKRMAEEVGKAFDGKVVTVSVEKRQKSRSPQQNRYYWGVVVAIIRRMLQDYDPTTVATPDLVHEYLKRRFLPMVTEWEEVVINAPDGRSEIIWTTTRLSTIQFMDYVELICEWASSFGWVVPSPDEWEFESVESIDVDAR